MALNFHRVTGKRRQGSFALPAYSLQTGPALR
jgi:hypothetical protein